MFTEKNFQLGKKIDYKEVEKRNEVNDSKFKKAKIYRGNKMRKDYDFDMNANLFMFVIVFLLFFGVLFSALKYF